MGKVIMTPIAPTQSGKCELNISLTKITPLSLVRHTRRLDTDREPRVSRETVNLTFDLHRFSLPYLAAEY